MARYRKKSIVVEAIQWLGWAKGPEIPCLRRDPDLVADSQFAVIYTLDGKMIVTPGDWIIAGIKGRKYPCKPDIFELTYEPLTQESTDGKKTNEEIYDEKNGW